MVIRVSTLSLLLVAALAVPAWSADPPQWTSGTYSYDGAGNIIGIGPNSDGKSDYYRYDPVSRLVDATAHTATTDNLQHYVYDVFGNLTRVDTNGQSLTIDVDPASNQIRPSGSGGGSAATAAYDVAGNQTGLNGVYAYDYDGLNAMTSLTAGARKERYIYDSEGQRVAVITGSSTSQHWRVTLRDGLAHVARELTDDTNGTTHQWLWLRDWIYAPSGVLAEVSASGSVERRRHFHPDHLGTPRLVTEDDGRVSAKQTLWAYGGFAPGSDRSGATMTFTGHERDFAAPGDENALDYMHARYYSPTLGRFLSVDPVIPTSSTTAPQQWNRYAYVAGNPIGNSDPTGKRVEVRKSDCAVNWLPCYTVLDAFQTLKDWVGPKAAQYLQLGKNGQVTLSSKITAAEFAKLGPGAALLGQLMAPTTSTAAFRLSPNVKDIYGNPTPARTSPDPKGTLTEINPQMFPNFIGGATQTMDTALAHDLGGHGLQDMLHISPMTKSFDRTYGSMDQRFTLGANWGEAFAITLENQYRQAMGMDIREYYLHKYDYDPPKP